MSAQIVTGRNLREIADLFGRGVHAEHFKDPRYVLDLTQPADVNRKLAPMMDRAAAKNGTPRSDTEKHDAVTAFTTTGLSQVLAPVILTSNRQFMFTPGYTGARGQMLPVNMTVDLGMQELTYDVIVSTGEARPMAAGATKDLRRVGESADQKKQPVFLYGVRFGWDWFELIQGAILGRSLQTERQRMAGLAMAEYFEYTASFGNTDLKVPGFFNHGSSITINLATNPGSATAAQLIALVSYIEAAWEEANPGVAISGVVMPNLHRLHMVDLFLGASNEGQNAWKHIQEAHPWLRNIVTTDKRLLTASPDGFSMWQLWAADSIEQYLESSPTPLLFGPFEDELETDFIMIQQSGGMVNKNHRRIMRVHMPS